MSLTLNPTLAAAQDSQSRHPILEIISSKMTEDIPFLGNRLTDSSSNETHSNMVMHSTGRVEVIYRTSGHLYLAYTDEAKTSFSYVDLPLGSFGTPVEATICELANGNIGIIFITATKLVEMVVSPTGTVVTAATEVASFTSGTVTSPFVIRLASGTYLLVYAVNDLGTYEIDKRTSSDFVTWSAEQDITPSGLVSTNWKKRPSLLQLTTGQVWMWFDYLNGMSGDTELVNVYYSTSDNDGVTWSAATKFTNYTQYGTSGYHPVATQQLANTMLMMFYEQTNAIHVDSDFAGFCSIDEGMPSAISHLTLDTVNRKLYCTCSQTGAGGGVNRLINIFRLDLATMTIDACWNDDSVPAFNAVLLDPGYGISPDSSRGDQHLVPVFSDLVLSVLDGEADTIANFYFKDYPAFGITQNVSWTNFGSSPYVVLGQIVASWADHSAQRLYVLLGSGDYWLRGLIIGYFDLTEAGETKTFHEIGRDVNSSYSQTEGIALCNGESSTFQVYPSEDLVLVSCSYGYPGFTSLYSLSTGGLYKKYCWADTPGYPYYGMFKCLLVDGKIYGGFPYYDLYGEVDKRGLARIDTATDSVAFFRPPWATADDYYIRNMALTDDNRLVICCRGYGVGIFDLTSQSWDGTLFNNTSLPGMDPDTGYPHQYFNIVWDAETNMIFVGKCYYAFSLWRGLIGFSDSGALKTSKYVEGTFTTSWSWEAAQDLVEGIRDYDAVGAYGGDSLYIFWTRMDPDDDSTKVFWDKEGNILNLEDYISREDVISIEWSAEGAPNRLTFAVSHGYLFDPHNTTSLYAGYLKKGRKLDIRMGELISGINYWQNQGVFFITEFSMTYERGLYPKARIVAEDRRAFWEHKQILVSEYYTTYPEDIIEDVGTSVLGMEAAEISLPVFANRTVLYSQWIEAFAKDIIDQVCQRFGYFPYFDVNGRLTAKRIYDGNGVDHTYPDSTKIINFSPNDKYSNFTNKIIVTGVERDYVEVIFDEEMVGQLNGTIGWWTKRETHDVHYSLDDSRRCRNPRLKVIQSVSSVGFQLSGQIHEYLVDEDPNEKYCTILITAPYLVPQALAFIGIIIAGYYVGDAVTYGWTRPVGTLMQMIALVGLNMTLAAIGNYQYEVWARPIGTQRRSIQNNDEYGNDYDHQVEIGEEIINKSEEPLAGTVAELNVVAEQKILVEKLQRKRVGLSKLAHLQDEVGDTIRVVHPHSNLNLDIFIAKLTRSMKLPSLKGAGNDGYFTDSIEGWKI